MKNFKIKFLFVGLLVFQSFNGLSGLLGGFMLTNDPTGSSLTMKQEWLLNTPFDNFLIPGIILLIVNGFGNVLGFIISIMKYRNYSIVGSLFGIIMMIWITTQVILIGYKDFLQPLYFSTGLLQAIFGYFNYKYNSKTS